MHCKHCFFIIDDTYDVCPNCGKSLKDEPVAEEQSDAIELPMKKNEVELTADDQFTANFISKDDPLAHIDEIAAKASKPNKMMIASRIAAILSVLFFIGVIYYTKVVQPKINKELSEASKQTEAGNDPDYTTQPAKDKLNVELDATFGDTTINSLLKDFGYEYSKDKQVVDLKLKYGSALNGTDFTILIKRAYSSGVYEDNISFKYGESSITGIIRTYTNYNEDLVTNILNSYVINKTGDLAVMHTKASTFQLGKPTTILLFRNGTYSKIDNVVTTYSTDGVSIVQCPITINESSISYCSIKDAFEKNKEVEISKIDRSLEGSETIKETSIGLVAK